MQLNQILINQKLRHLKSKVDKLDVDKLVPVHADLSKLSHAVKTDVVKNDACNAKYLLLLTWLLLTLLILK